MPCAPRKSGSRRWSQASQMQSLRPASKKTVRRGFRSLRVIPASRLTFKRGPPMRRQQECVLSPCLALSGPDSLPISVQHIVRQARGLDLAVAELLEAAFVRRRVPLHVALLPSPDRPCCQAEWARTGAASSRSLGVRGSRRAPMGHRMQYLYWGTPVGDGTA